MLAFNLGSILTIWCGSVIMSNHSFQLFKDACWLAVQVDVEAFQVVYFKALKGEAVLCPYTNTVLTSENATTECLNLEKMTRRFVMKYQVGEDIAYTVEQGQQRLADSELSAQWRHHFALYADLRLILKTDAVSYEPSDHALMLRATLRQRFLDAGYTFGGNPKS